MPRVPRTRWRLHRQNPPRGSSDGLRLYGLVASPMGCHRRGHPMTKRWTKYLTNPRCSVTVITFPLYIIPRFPTHLIPNILDFGLSTRRGPVPLCLIACVYSVGEGAELRYRLQLRRNGVCTITILSSHMDVTTNCSLSDDVKEGVSTVSG